jgi:Nucleotidyltransferase domain
MPGRAVDSRGTPGLAEDPTGHAQILAQRAGVAIPHIERARDHTAAALERTREILLSEDVPNSISVCVFGSWGRQELTPGSDHDWAILSREPRPIYHPDIVKAMVVGQRHLDVAGHTPGSQATFGVPIDVETLANNIGLEADTNNNLTRRMLLLLESCALTGAVHAAGWSTVLDRYMSGIKHYRPPRFLLNDLTRYWRTICVDFEGKHYDSEGKDKKWVTRNAKLRTSRKLLFAGGLVPILLCSLKTIEQMPPFLTTWLAATPLDRLAAAYLWADAEAEGARALGAYDEWLSIQLDRGAREELLSLTQDTRRGSALFAQIEDIGERLQAALLALLFESRLATVSRQYLVF